jgi:hypothetical protein
LGQGLLEAAGLLLVGGGELFGPGVEVLEPLVEAADHARLQPEGALGDPVQEGPVVADDQSGRLQAGELGLERLDGEDVEVVGGLVQQDDVGVLGEGLGQRGAAGFAAGQALGGLGGVEAEGVEPGLGHVGLAPPLTAWSRTVAAEIGGSWGT